jgi:hypothetical protein
MQSLDINGSNLYISSQSRQPGGWGAAGMSMTEGYVLTPASLPTGAFVVAEGRYAELHIPGESPRPVIVLGAHPRKTPLLGGGWRRLWARRGEAPPHVVLIEWADSVPIISPTKAGVALVFAPASRRPVTEGGDRLTPLSALRIEVSRHLRGPFTAWLAGWAAGDAPDYIEVDGEKLPVELICNRLWHCGDSLPEELCRLLGLAPGTSFAAIVRRVRRWARNGRPRIPG